MKNLKTKITLSEENVKEIIADYLRGQGYSVVKDIEIDIFEGFKITAEVEK